MCCGYIINTGAALTKVGRVSKEIIEEVTEAELKVR